jgi:hypothetical protein
VVPSAYLRVFQPLGSFQPEEQARWERYLVDGVPPPSPRRSYRQRATTGRLGILAPVEGEHADVRLVGKEYYLCPWRTRLRVLAGLLSFREAAPIELSEQFVPRGEAKKAAKELARMRRKDPSAVSFIHESPWHVPVRWFVLFSDEERKIVEREDGGYRLSYLTLARRALRRAERAFPVLRRSELGSIADLILELHEWLSQFDPSSLLELDYDGLCDLMTWDELDDDHSARDLHEALSALASGEFPRSAELYQGVMGHWAEVRNREASN